jgi:hypothetical protein
MPYRIIKQPEFSSSFARIMPGPVPDEEYFLSGTYWTLERDPHIGREIQPDVWILKILWAPIVATIYYAIDERANVVYLLDIRV